MRLFKFHSIAGERLRYPLDAIVHEQIHTSTRDSWNDPEDGAFNFNDALRQDTARRQEHAEALVSLSKNIRAIRCVSFSSTAIEPLLWAHYAGGFSGVALEYEIADDGPFMPLLPMRYDNPPVLAEADYRSILDGNTQPWHHGVLLTKRPCWTYESEYRAFWLADTEFIERQRPLSVLLGVRNSPALRLLETVAHRFGIPVKYLYWADTCYSIME